MAPAPAVTTVVAELVGSVSRLLDARRRQPVPVVVGLDGRSGAGKSTLAVSLADELTRVRRVGVTTVSLEVLYPGWSGLAAGTRVWSGKLLPRLADGQVVTYEPWDWEARRPGAATTARPAPLVLAEGVGVGVRAARPRLDLLVWVAAPAPTRRERALSRDGDVFAPWWDSWAVQEDGLLASDPIPDHADLVVDAAAADARGWRVVAGRAVAQDGRS